MLVGELLVCGCFVGAVGVLAWFEFCDSLSDALYVVEEFLDGFWCEGDGDSVGFDDVVMPIQVGVDVFFV